MSAEDLFHHIVVTALEAAPKNTMQIKNLRRATKITRGITSVVQNMKARNLVTLSAGEISMETEVSLSHG